MGESLGTVYVVIEGFIVFLSLLLIVESTFGFIKVFMMYWGIQ